MSGAVRPVSSTGDLLYDIANAYVADRGLGACWILEVVQMVDSVL
jgi:hypothetical protein